jgi:putative peptidoglycan lipid II flippase
MLLFQRGSFDVKATAMTATVLSIFAPALVFQGLTQFFMVPFFASGKTKLIMYFRILFLGLNFVVSFVLFQLMGGYGLAAALPVSTCLQAMIWLFLLSVELEGLDREFYAFLIKFLSILALISLGFYFSVGWISRIDNIYLLIGFNGLLLLFGYLIFILLTMKTGLISTGDLSKIRAIFIKRDAASFPK